MKVNSSTSYFSRQARDAPTVRPSGIIDTVKRTVLYFDVGSPYAYLALERATRVLGAEPEWQPVLVGALFKLAGRSSWALGDFARRQAGMAEVERRAAAYGLPPVRWPDPWPGDYLTAMRAATHARRLGRTLEFAHAAARAAFVEGRDLTRTDEVLRVGDALGIELREAIADPEVKAELRAATDAAHARGVFGVPTIAVGDELFWGDDRLEDAAGAAT
jgi:2-hydroxychromene-2-carboxylate isomerase